MPIPNSLFVDLESMKNMLIATACGGDRGDSSYPDLRKSLLKSSISGRLPRFIHSCRSLAEFWGFIQPKFKSYRERSAFLVEEFAPLLDELERLELHPGLAPIQDMLARVDSKHVRDAWQKALERRTEDPEGAITAARTLLETVCKHILDSCSIPYNDKEELPGLHALAIEQLNLAPSQHTEPIFKTILGNCQAVVNGLGTMRNRLGDAHGRAMRQVKPAPRHAELAVNLAGTMASFLVSTWEIKEPLVSTSRRLTPDERQVLLLARQQGDKVSMHRVKTETGMGLAIDGLADLEDGATTVQALFDRGILGGESMEKALTYPLTPLGLAVAAEVARNPVSDGKSTPAPAIGIPKAK